MRKEIKKPPNSNNRMTAPSNRRRTVVLDGSNIVHGGKGARSQEPDGNRLMSAIALYESKGYVVIPCMKKGTFHVMSGEALNRETEEKIPKAPGFDSLLPLSKSRFLRLFKSDDDLHIIHLALLKNAWIVTNDTFEDSRHHESGELIPRERTSHPELDWDLIDEMTWGTTRSGHRVYADDTWKTEGPKFIHPTLIHAPTSLFEDEYTEIREAISQLAHILQEVVRLSEKEDSRITDVNGMARKWVRSVKRMAKMIPGQKTPDRESLSQMTVQELKKMCLELDLKRTGKKAELVDRILEALPSEETREESQEHVIFVPLKNRKEVGAVIGIGGERIRAIQAETGAWLSVDDIGMTLQLSGSKETVDQAKELVEQTLKEFRSRANSSHHGEEILPFNRLGKRALLIVDKHREIPAIRHIKQHTGAKLYIHDIPENDEEWTLTISGTPESIQKAKEMVEETINQAKVEHEKRKAAHEKREAEQQKAKAAKKAAHEKREAERQKAKAAKKDAHEKRKAAKKDAHEKRKAAKKAIREAEKGMTEQEKRQAQSKRDKAKAAAKKAKKATPTEKKTG